MNLFFFSEIWTNLTSVLCTTRDLAPTVFFLIGPTGKRGADSELRGDQGRHHIWEQEQDPETSAERREEWDLECPDRLLGTKIKMWL